MTRLFRNEKIHSAPGETLTPWTASIRAGDDDIKAPTDDVMRFGVIFSIWPNFNLPQTTIKIKRPEPNSFSCKIRKRVKENYFSINAVKTYIVNSFENQNFGKNNSKRIFFFSSKILITRLFAKLKKNCHTCFS